MAASPVRYTPGTVCERLAAAPGDAELLTAWAALLSWYSGSDEVTVALASGTARLDLADEPTAADLLARAVSALAAPAAATGTAAIWFGESPPQTTELALGRSADDPAVLELTYATELFDESNAQQMLSDLTGLLHGSAQTPNDPVPDIAVRCIEEAEVTR